MHPLLNGALWLALLLLLGVGVVGATSTPLPVAGLVVGPTLLWCGLRHRQHAPRLLWGALSGRLPIECWPEAREVVVSARHGGEGGAWIAAALSLLVVPHVSATWQIAATVQALSPLVVAYGLSLLLWRPLERHLLQGYTAWIAGLKEALTPPVQQVQRAAAPLAGRRAPRQRRRSA